jgi:large subunit ribosomal protein L9
MVEVILLERVEKLGQMGQVVKVRPGFARNYLLPKKKALRATKENLAYFETQRAQLEAQNLSRRSEAEQVAKTLDGLAVIVIRQAGESGQLYGSVTARDISDAVTQAGFTIGRAQVVLDKAIKTLGLYKQRIVLHPEVSVGITVNVAQSAEEAEMQAKGMDPVRLAQEAAAREAAAALEAPQETTEPEAPPEEAAPRREKAGARAEEPTPRRGKAEARAEEPARRRGKAGAGAEEPSPRRSRGEKRADEAEPRRGKAASRREKPAR